MKVLVQETNMINKVLPVLEFIFHVVLSFSLVFIFHLFFIFQSFFALWLDKFGVEVHLPSYLTKPMAQDKLPL